MADDKQTLHEIFAQRAERQPTAIEVIKEGIQAVAPGLSLDKIFGDIAEKADQMWTQGRSEIAQALFTDGTAYVAYGPGQNPGDKDHDTPLHGLAEAKEVEKDQGLER